MGNEEIKNYFLPAKNGNDGRSFIVRDSRGFSFIELLITLAVFSILMGAIFSFFASQRDTYMVEDLKLERDQNLRMAMETIFRELSMAGYRAADASLIGNLPKWVPLGYLPSGPVPVVLDANPKITLGDGDLPDVISFAGSVSTATNPTTLSEESGGISITVSLTNGSSEKQFKAGDIISVGYLPEHAWVADVDGKILMIDADPEASGLQPLQAVYPAGTPLEEISIISYAVFNDDNDPACKRHEAGRPELKRKINAAGFYPVAENISQMKVTEPEDGVLDVSLTGQTYESHFSGPENGEKTIAARVSLRNGLTAGFASGCARPEVPAGLVVEEGLDEIYPCCVLISWDPVTVNTSGENLEKAGCPLMGYRVYYDSVPGVFGNYVDVSTNEASGCIVDVSRIPSSVFYFSVAAENSGGIGEKSPEVEITDVTAPEKTMGVSAAVVGIDKIALAWEENSECDLAGYYIYRKKESGPLSLATGLIAPGVGGYTDSGLGGGASYTYKIEAVDFGFNAGGMSDPVTVWLP